MRFDRKNSTVRLDFIARQLTGLMADQSPEAALAKVTEECPAYAAEVEVFRALLHGAEADSDALDNSPFQTLNGLMQGAPAASSALFREYNDYLHRSRMIFQTYWAGISGLIWYLGVISIIALLLGALFVLSVLPGMNTLYESNGASLPALTQTFFSFGDLGLPVFAIVLIASVGSAAWLAFRFRARTRKLAPLPRWAARLPVFGSIAESYNLGLFLNGARMLRKCGTGKDEAIRTAARVSNQAEGLSLAQLTEGARGTGAGHELSELAVAERLGNFDPELDHQCDRHLVTLTRVLVSGRERLALIFKLFIYAVIATVVISMYLPMFQLAGIV